MNNLQEELKVSIIVPVHNGEKTLETCLDSLVKQDFKDYAIIIVDNNSNDNTKNIIGRFLNNFSNIKYVFESRLGRGYSRNAGIEASNTDIVAMIDADCIAPENWLAEITKPIREGRELVVSGFQKDFINNYWSTMRQNDDWRFIESKIKNNYIDHLDTKNFAIDGNLLRSMKFNPDISNYEDWEFFLRLKKQGIKIKFLPELLVVHHHDASFMELFRTQFSRGENAFFIFKTYSKDQKLKELLNDDESANSFKIKNFIFFIPWAVWQFIINYKKAPYIVVSDFAWKMGALSFFLNNFLKIF